MTESNEKPKILDFIVFDVDCSSGNLLVMPIDYELGTESESESVVDSFCLTAGYALTDLVGMQGTAVKWEDEEWLLIRIKTSGVPIPLLDFIQKRNS